MCGIVGFTGQDNALPILLKGLYSLEYRGYDSAGIAAFTEHGLEVIKSRGRISNLEERIRESGGMHACCGIGHTRWATHGEPSDRNSHPHLGGKDGKSGKIASSTTASLKTIWNCASGWKHTAMCSSRIPIPKRLLIWSTICTPAKKRICA